MKRWLLARQVADPFAAMALKINETTTIIRGTADDPDMVEGDLRHTLREAARLIDHLGDRYRQSLVYQRRAGRRFAVLTGLFFGLAALQVAGYFVR